MLFKQFVEQIAKNIIIGLKKLGYKEVEVDYRYNKKVNGASYRELFLCQEGEPIGVSLNLDQYYEMLGYGFDFETVAEAVMKVAASQFQQVSEIEESEFYNYEAVKGKLILCVLGVEKNRELLEEVPHVQVEDLALVYRIKVDDHGGGVLVRNFMLSFYGISKEQLHEDALKNAPTFWPVTVCPMSQIWAKVYEYCDVPEEVQNADKLFVAKAEAGCHGAAAFAYPGFLKQTAEQFGSSFYILPSSIHELLFIKEADVMEPEELFELVKSANDTDIKPEEVLSYNVYHYDKERDVFETAGTYLQNKNNDYIKADVCRR